MAPKPARSIAAWVVEGIWPEDSYIQARRQQVQQFEQQATQHHARADELEQTHHSLKESMKSEKWDDNMHRESAVLYMCERHIAENFDTMASQGQMNVDEICSGQAHLADIANATADEVQQLCEAGAQQLGAVAMSQGKVRAVTAANKHAATITAWNAQMNAKLWKGREVSGYPAPPTAPEHHTPSIGNGAHVSPMDHTTDKGSEGTDSNKTGGGRQSEDKANSDGKNPDTTDEAKSGQGRRSESEGHVGNSAGQGLNDSHGKIEQRSSGGSSAAGAQAPAMPSGGLPGSGGGGSPASSLGGLTSGLGSGMGSGLKSPAEGLGGAGRFSPPSVPASGLGSGLGTGGSGSSGGGSGSGSPSVRLSAPATPPPPIVTSQVAPTPNVSSAGAGVVAPSTAAAPVSATSPGTSGGFMGGGPMTSTAAPAGPGAPAAPSVAPAPSSTAGTSTASAAAGAAGAQAGANQAGGPAQGVMGMVPADLSDKQAAPGSRDRFTEQAVAAVEALLPGVAAVPGLLVAAAIIRVSGGVPMTVFTTNDGAGFLPSGFFTPQSMIHAGTDIGDVEFLRLWYGWADPAAVLLAYADTRQTNSGMTVEVLGLASAGPVTPLVKEHFRKVVPSVTPRPGSSAFGEEGGRNAHRLKVLSPRIFNDLMGLEPRHRPIVAARAVAAAMNTAAAVPLTAPGGVWQEVAAGRVPTVQQWDDLEHWYRAEQVNSGARRPGWLADARPGIDTHGYREGFARLCAADALLAWRTDPPAIPDVVYSAYCAGADISRIFGD